MYESIVLSSCFFGSVYLFSTSLQMINILDSENKKIPNSLIVMNGLVLVGSGYIFLCGARSAIKTILHM